MSPKDLVKLQTPNLSHVNLFKKSAPTFDGKKISKVAMSERNENKVESFVAFTKEAKISGSEKEMVRIYRKTKEAKEAIVKHRGEYNQLSLQNTQGMTQLS